MKISVLAISILCGACSPQSVDSQQPGHIEASGTYVHRGTTFSFPTKVGPFSRSVITKYNPEETDVSVGYDLYNGERQVAATVFVYPAPPIVSVGSPQSVVEDARQHLCDQAWESIKAEIAQAHPDAKLVALDFITSPSRSFEGKGHRAVFEFSSNFAGAEQRVHSEADLFCYVGAKWLIAYRTTAPIAFDYRPDLTDLMRDLRWPASLK